MFLVLVVVVVWSVAGLVPTLAASDAAAAPSRAQVASPPKGDPVTAPPSVNRTEAAAPGAAAAPFTAPETQIEDRQSCPSQFVACVDLRSQRAWLQRGTAVAYGPAPIMPGTETSLVAPGPESSATPTGSFEVLSKNATQVSSEFDEPMPNAVFFAPSGIAFHEGGLADSSHGCAHLGAAAAAAFFDQLQIGDPVLVF